MPTCPSPGYGYPPVPGNTHSMPGMLVESEQAAETPRWDRMPRTSLVLVMPGVIPQKQGAPQDGSESKPPSPVCKAAFGLQAARESIAMQTMAVRVFIFPLEGPLSTRIVSHAFAGASKNSLKQGRDTIASQLWEGTRTWVRWEQAGRHVETPRRTAAQAGLPEVLRRVPFVSLEDPVDAIFIVELSVRAEWHIMQVLKAILAGSCSKFVKYRL